MSDSSIESTIAQHSVEINQIVKTLGDISGEIKENRRHSDANFEILTNKLSNIGRPNIPAIVSLCVLTGSIAVAFIAPLKSDIERQAHSADLLAQAVIVKEEKIQGLLTADSEFREKQKAMRDKLDDVATNGSTVARERLAVIENDLRWMRGEKQNKP